LTDRWSYQKAGNLKIKILRLNSESTRLLSVMFCFHCPPPIHPTPRLAVDFPLCPSPCQHSMHTATFCFIHLIVFLNITIYYIHTWNSSDVCPCPRPRDVNRIARGRHHTTARRHSTVQNLRWVFEWWVKKGNEAREGKAIIGKKVNNNNREESAYIIARWSL